MAALAALYNAFLRAENRVGGGEGLVGIYGSMTQAGTSLIMGAMAEHAGLGSKSVLVDIGCGLCRPLLHASVEFGVERTYGVELDAVKCQKAVPFVQHTLGMMAKEGFAIPETALPTIICMPIEQMSSLEPATHAYAAWEGFPETAKEAVGAVFRASRTLVAITIVQRSMRNQNPEEVMSELGFGDVECKASALPVHMAGSRRKLNAYLFVKRGLQQGAGSALPAVPGTSLSTALPFDPKQVMSELTRMASNDSRAAAAKATAGSPSSDRTTFHESSAVGSEAHRHGHGLRPRRSSVPSLGASSGNHTSRPGLSTTGSGSLMLSGGAGNEPDLQGLALASPGTKRSAGDAAPHEDDDVVPSQVSHAAGRAARTKAGGRKPPVARALATTLLSADSGRAGGVKEEQVEELGLGGAVPDVASQPDQQATAAAPRGNNTKARAAGDGARTARQQEAGAGRAGSAPRSKSATRASK